ncbi:MAG TPA: hypothetical protein GX404_01595 [Syntrophomonadaceae bacterium]|jgi:hypothetical protein|nr:hypothetical protein [Syntrophomonadaceae bacterium]
MFHYSWTYRLLAGSWLLGWLVSTPPETETVAYESVFSPLVRRSGQAVLQWLYKCGAVLRRWGEGSWILNNWLGLLGLLIAGLGLGRFITGAGLRIPAILVLIGIAVAVQGFLPLAWQGSRVMSASYRLIQSD